MNTTLTRSLPLFIVTILTGALAACGSNGGEPTLDTDTGTDLSDVSDSGAEDAGNGDTGPDVDAPDVDAPDPDTGVFDADTSGGDDPTVDTTPDTAPPTLDIEEVEDTWTDTGPDYLFDVQDLVAFVDPMIGTEGSGNAIPGALVPHGVVRLSPVTNIGTNAVDAYEYREDTIYGFAHTHLEGPGGSGNGYSQLMVMPVFDGSADPEANASTFSHENEEAHPGHYQVTLDSGIRAELTATRWAGVHRYTFPVGSTPQVALDLGQSRGRSTGGELTVVDAQTVEGMAEYNIHPVIQALVGDGDRTAQSRVYFTAHFDTPMSASALSKGRGDAALQDVETLSGSWLGALVSFPADTETIELRVGLSLIDVEHARANLNAEVGGMSFEEVQAANEAAWNHVLNRAQVEGDDDAKTRFYTALYHFAFQPADYTESDGSFYLAADGYDHTIPPQAHRYFTDDWCMWDTYRTSWPLRTFMEPELVDGYMASLLLWSDVGGWIPRCTWNATGYSRVMTGNNAFPIIADAVVRGFDGFDRERLLAAMVHTASEDDNPYPATLCGYLGTGTNPEYVENGYVDHTCDPTQSASMTMEYAYHDWCVAEVARVVGDEPVEAEFMRRSENWRNQWDPETGFPRGREADGTWVTPFDPTSTDDNNDFVEANAWIFSFFVPHDFPGMIDAMGERSLSSRLETFFAEGYYDPSNQPSFHIPYLHNLAGEAAITQRRVWDAREENFPLANDGLPGNDDAGSTSAWFVLSAMGLYPITPGSPVYQLTTPLFERVELHLNQYFSSGETFVIEAPGVSPTARYIQSATLNGEPLTRTWITHDELNAGGTLHFEVGDAPSTWGE